MSRGTLFVSCSVQGCERNAHWSAKGVAGLCANHDYRKKQHGDPLGGRTAPGEPERFINRFLSSPPNTNACVYWPFARNSAGYGHRLTGDGHRLVHREVCEAFHGPQPDEREWVAHSCGNGSRGCINPSHLRWASPAENSHDTVLHGRSQRGEKMYAAKLTETKVMAIRAHHAAGESMGALARRYSVTASNIRAVVRRKTWRHVA